MHLEGEEIAQGEVKRKLSFASEIIFNSMRIHDITRDYIS